MRKSIYIRGMQRNFCCNLFQRFVQIFFSKGAFTFYFELLFMFSWFSKTVLGEKGENHFIARIVFFFVSKRAQIKSFLPMLYKFYFGSVFLCNCSSFSSYHSRNDEKLSLVLKCLVSFYPKMPFEWIALLCSVSVFLEQI